MPWGKKTLKSIKNKFIRSNKKKEHSSDQGGIPTEETTRPTGDKNRLLLTDKKNQVPHQPRGAKGGASFENPHYDPPVSDQKEYAAAVNQQAEPDLTLGAYGPNISRQPSSKKKYPTTPPHARKQQRRRSNEQSRPASSVRGSQILESVDEDTISHATSSSDLRQNGTRYKSMTIIPRQGYSGRGQRLQDQKSSLKESLQCYAKSEDILATRRSSGYGSDSSDNMMTRQSLENLRSSMETLTDRVSQLESSNICSNCSSMRNIRDSITDLHEQVSNTSRTLYSVTRRLKEVEDTTEEHDEKLMELREKKANHHTYDDDSEDDSDDDLSYGNDGLVFSRTINIGSY